MTDVALAPTRMQADSLATDHHRWQTLSAGRSLYRFSRQDPNVSPPSIFQEIYPWLVRPRTEQEITQQFVAELLRCFPLMETSRVDVRVDSTGARIHARIERLLVNPSRLIEAARLPVTTQRWLTSGRELYAYEVELLPQPNLSDDLVGVMRRLATTLGVIEEIVRGGDLLVQSLAEVEALRQNA